MVYSLPDDIAEFSNEVKRTINNKFLYEDKAEGWGVQFDGRILLHIQPDENFKQDLFLLLDLYDGECKNIDVQWGEEPDGYGFAYRGAYTDWKELMQTTSKESLSDGTFKMEGDLNTWLEYKDANYMRIGCAQELETKFQY